MDPGISYPPELPISERRDDLLAAIRAHQVLVVAGETGSGKSTQLPKLCLEAGRGTTDESTGRGEWIGHTQPRRIAARSIAERVADELGSEVGQTVGYKVRCPASPRPTDGPQSTRCAQQPTSASSRCEDRRSGSPTR